MARDQRFIQQKHLKMKIQYIKRINSKVPCRTCKGTGKYEVKEYHNQYREVKCYLCDASGQIDFTEETDITKEIDSLLQKTQTTL
jgi:DnaJ-class molecular chaperone